MGTLAVQGAKIYDFGVSSGHLLGSIWGTFWTSTRKRSRKNTKKSVSGSGPEKSMSLTASGEAQNVIRSINTICFVRSAGPPLEAFGVTFGAVLGTFGARDRNWGSQNRFQKETWNSENFGSLPATTAGSEDRGGGGKMPIRGPSTRYP